VVICEEPLPPNCNQFYGRKCDKFLVRCVFANSSDTGDKQCQCYETYVDCLRKIDRKECMRGAHCKLYDNACKSFYCKKEPIRCPTCYATSEIDIPIKEQSFFFRMVSSPPGMITFLLIFVFLSYQCCMFLNKVIFHGASCKIKTCPFYKHWKKIKTKKKLRRFCKRCRLNLQKYLARVQSKYHQVNGGGDGGSGDGGSVGNGGGGGGGGGSCRAIIMAPTRELAAQIYDWVNKLSKFINDPNIQSTLIVGGNDFKQNSNPNNAHIVIGTCGRLRDTLNRNKINTNNVRFFVLDEADQMVKDKESLSIVREIHQTLINTASKESARLQVCFFSATLHTPGVRELAEQMTYHATWVDLKGKDVVPETVDHLIVPVTSTSKSTPWGDSYKYDQFTDGVHSKDNLLMRRPVKNINNDSVALARSQVIKRMKLEAVKDIVDTFSMSTCMIFCRTNVDCNMLEEYFSFLSKQIGGGRGSKHQSGVKRESGKENIYSCVVVAGKRQQRERRENLEAFKDGDVRFLICTDVAARGIDLKELPFVINMTLPDEPEQYYHRIGRVGRAGRMGLAISIVACDGSDNEKVWYHSNCKNKKMCHQTKLVKHGGCCIYYNEKLCLKNIEDKLGEKILRMNSDSGGLTLPNNMNVNDYGELLSKKNSGGNNSKTSEHVQSVMPAVMELCEIEMETQKLWLRTKRKKY
jgi:ATP-dependent RNA helicase DDX1